MDQPANTKELYEGALYSLLRDKLPSEYVHDGKVNTRLLSEATENARFTIYRWFHENKLSPKAIKSLLEVSAKADRLDEKDRLTKNDLIPFLPIP